MNNKFIVVVFALCLAITAKAQETISDVVTSEASTSSKTSSTTTVDAFIIEYQAAEDGFGIGFSGHSNHFEFGASYLFGDTNDVISESSAFRVKLGGNYAYWIGDSFYIEGSIGLMYNHSELKYKGSDTEKDNTFGFYVSPRIGYKLTKGFGITAAYNWDFNKFKTSSENTADYFSVGIIIGI